MNSTLYLQPDPAVDAAAVALLEAGRDGESRGDYGSITVRYQDPGYGKHTETEYD